jgi:hypothetical protein
MKCTNDASHLTLPPRHLNITNYSASCVPGATDILPSIMPSPTFPKRTGVKKLHRRALGLWLYLWRGERREVGSSYPKKHIIHRAFPCEGRSTGPMSAAGNRQMHTRPSQVVRPPRPTMPRGKRDQFAESRFLYCGDGQ